MPQLRSPSPISSSALNNHEFSSSPPRQPSVSSAPITSPAGPAIATPDEPWDAAWWARFPGHIMASNSGERSWWWTHGYRLYLGDDNLPITSRYVWVCKLCVAKRRPPSVAYYRFIASTGRFITRYFWNYRIGRGGINPSGGRFFYNSQQAIIQYLNANVSNP
jgi:hypothetical protein